MLIIDPLERIIINTAKALCEMGNLTLLCTYAKRAIHLTLSNHLTLSVPVTKPADTILQRLLVLAPNAQL